jgi:hypothetical protein
MTSHRFAATLVVILLASGGIIAHHSFAAEFDADRPIKLTGAVTEMRWSNPHAWIYLDVKETDGKVVNWAFELTGVNALYCRGWRKEDLVHGTVLVIEGFRARNNTPTANAESITLPDGRKLFAGSSRPGSK